MAVNNLDLPVTLLQSQDYDLFAHEAQRIVDLVLKQSLIHVNESSESIFDEDGQRTRFVESQDQQERGHSLIKWPSIAEFTDEKVGLNKITEYIEKEWKIGSGSPDPCWLYSIDFLERRSLEFTDLYLYRVCYSIPTRRQPIPRQTVSIYFTLDVSKVKQKNTSIKVSFVFETMRLVHSPDQFRFRQNWMENIVLLKEKLSHGIDF